MFFHQEILVLALIISANRYEWQEDAKDSDAKGTYPGSIDTADGDVDGEKEKR